MIIYSKTLSKRIFRLSKTPATIGLELLIFKDVHPIPLLYKTYFLLFLKDRAGLLR